jgi:hypothetical protein
MADGLCGVLKGLQALRRYSTDLNVQKFPVKICSGVNACWAMDQKFIRLKSGDRAGHWLSLQILSTVHRKSGSGAVWQCEDTEAVSHHAWTTCVVVDEEAHVPRVLVNHSTNRCYTATLTLSRKATERKIWSPKMPTQTMSRPYLKYWFPDVIWQGIFVHVSTISP